MTSNQSRYHHLEQLEANLKTEAAIDEIHDDFLGSSSTKRRDQLVVDPMMGKQRCCSRRSKMHRCLKALSLSGTVAAAAISLAVTL